MAMSGLHTLAVSLGSNLEDRLGQLVAGLRALEGRGFDLLALSSVYETRPIGYSDQPYFLNMAVLACTDLPPGRVLPIFQSVEESAGRIRALPNGPRTLDLDLLFYDELILRGACLTVPHPRWKERSFVVRPLAEIAPLFRDPETGWQVEEVAETWPMEPEDVRTFLSAEGFQKALKEWRK